MHPRAQGVADEAEQFRPSAHHLMPLTLLSKMPVIIESEIKIR
jgi:hypothetical protein